MSGRRGGGVQKKLKRMFEMIIQNLVYAYSVLKFNIITFLPCHVTFTHAFSLLTRP